MADYGHELLFGTFITPAATQPQHAVALAQTSEQAGLDLATLQDHPYQPKFLDTWTLLSYIAARTERLRLATNVVNLPLRPPAVLAQSAASLDLLSGGRFELGLGAGGFWDAIEAMGGRRLTPGESVEATEEAIRVIRAMWAADERGGVRVDGKHYRVLGAKRGPAPAHPIPIWLGAYKPRMLRLLGRVADGWLPSLGYLPGREALTELNAIIDESAGESGRDPYAVRRLLNVGPQDVTPDSLAELALEYGISAFILATDDPRLIQEFGAEIAPAVREIVADERAGTTHAVEPEQAPAPGELGVVPTPAPGTRHTANLPWDESTRPSRAAEPGEHGYTEQGRAVSRHLVNVHNGLRTELQQVRDLVDQVRKGAVEVAAARSQINEMTMRQNNWTVGAYCESYCRIVTQHHTLEDEGIFRHLRSGDDTLGPVLDRLEQEHLAIHDVLEGVDRALVKLVAHPGDYTGLEEAVDLLTDTLLSHFAYEERELLEPLARLGMFAGQL
ncbi:Flavin-dependent oxidoreductase, luciferase family (includes alkanesulfonate monooxygenase SsuD and methylene tetrahydromethanopterin reductase) [Amycolatopsis marina]|uniref:Flavin-dependent oxidoreductase, luciferase family (Includes alkanesulfonate monooxygenase SsuD and methylene tetrahydromethanopterin reductase) n=1 Tax=Amycolatopsis marina TaxID=490629 RepID=A0A1I0W7V6_9PSEU|nr:LLM class flavin-dependent oxidoreductase [Amycolatopsis marina]SFA84397.1 Flavin-dependent oxidoreductase, luciferase family (includes alkanesulfonate monooxygenase SsuD and methylene tetrahydromethanopterin reductase) [Amycolatopsis marina]